MRKLRTIEMNRLTLEEFKEAEKLPLIVVLDDVRSLYNVPPEDRHPTERQPPQPLSASLHRSPQAYVRAD